MDGHLKPGFAAAKADHDAALAAFRVALDRLKAAKAALKPFLEQAAADDRYERQRTEAAAVQAWLDGATEKEAAAIAGYKSPKGFDSVRYNLINRYASETFLTAYDESRVDGEWSSKRHHEVLRRQAFIALTRYYSQTASLKETTP